MSPLIDADRDQFRRGPLRSTRFDRPEWRDGPEHRCLYPTTLSIDTMSGADIGALPWRQQAGREQIQNPGVIRVDRVRDLNFTVEGFYDYDIAKYVFENAKSLRSLALQSA